MVCEHVWATLEVTVPDAAIVWRETTRFSAGRRKSEFAVSGRLIDKYLAVNQDMSSISS